MAISSAASTSMNRDDYRYIIETYFKAFENGHFSCVAFSSSVEFLSPISGDTF
jgi:hypothetical protein